MDVSQILPNLFVGYFPENPDDIDGLRGEFGITAVLNVQTDEDMAHYGIIWRRLESHYRSVGIDARRIPVRDFDPDDLRRKSPMCGHTGMRAAFAGGRAWAGLGVQPTAG